MSRRRRAREHALKALFSADASRLPPREALDLFVSHHPPDPGVADFFHRLVDGVCENRERIDSLIQKHSKNWKLSRMSGVDRNIMRIAVYEYLFCPDIPSRVTINEAVEIGKRYGSDESGAFINGILDAVAAELSSMQEDPEG
ncbi:MAG: transcription antitermination factor NusB [Deltaproteobacteria bacterium]|nr:transcription antitermination factor NusB [Deltaproteobacteria bacterium]